jgi:hypothetical protein
MGNVRVSRAEESAPLQMPFIHAAGKTCATTMMEKLSELCAFRFPLSETGLTGSRHAEGLVLWVMG